MGSVKPLGKEKVPEKRAVIVDDDARFRNVLCKFVKGLGYSRMQANSGRLALAQSLTTAGRRGPRRR